MEAKCLPQQSHISVSLLTIATPSGKVSCSEAAVDCGTKSYHITQTDNKYSVDTIMSLQLFNVLLHCVTVPPCLSQAEYRREVYAEVLDHTLVRMAVAMVVLQT